jgi:vacuolar protein sorting-associated protein 35
MCHVLVRDQPDRTLPTPNPGMRSGAGPIMGGGGRGQQQYDLEEMTEEQGWIARLVHLFKAEDLEVQFKVRLL